LRSTIRPTDGRLVAIDAIVEEQAPVAAVSVYERRNLILAVKSAGEGLPRCLVAAPEL
jgi:hypothetical protein